MNRKQRRAKAKEKPFRVVMPNGHLYDYTSTAGYVMKMKSVVEPFSTEVVFNTTIA